MIFDKSLSERLRATGLDCAVEAARILDSAPLQMDDLKVDLTRNTASRFGRTIMLTQNQAAILYTLNRAHGDVVSMKDLHRSVYGRLTMEVSPRRNNTLRKQTHILRKAVEGPLRVVVQNRFNRGYLLRLLPITREEREELK